FLHPTLHLPLSSFPTRRSSDLDGSLHRAGLSLNLPVSDSDPRNSGILQSRRYHDLHHGTNVWVKSRWVRGRNRVCSVRCSRRIRSEEHTSELQSRGHLVCRLLL